MGRDGRSRRRAPSRIGTWIAFGSVALYGSDASLRLALPGPPWTLITARSLRLRIRLSRRPLAEDAAPLWLPAVALLPWLPLPLPAGGAVWTGPLARGACLSCHSRVIVPPLSQRWRPGFSPAVRGDDRNDAQAEAWAYAALVSGPAVELGLRTLAFALAAALYVGAAWRLSPVLPSGDEPHYLVIAESLLRDGDLRIENNHASRGYLAYVDGELKPDYLRRGRDRQIYSIHAPGFQRSSFRRSRSAVIPASSCSSRC